jgi:hypothetical protein
VFNQVVHIGRIFYVHFVGKVVQKWGPDSNVDVLMQARL